MLFGIPESDFHINYRIIVTVKNIYWIVNGLSVEDGISLSFSLSFCLSLSLTHTHTRTHNTFRVEKLFGLNTTHVFIDFHRI